VAAAPYVMAMTRRLRWEQNFREEPANIFQFPDERRSAAVNENLLARQSLMVNRRLYYPAIRGIAVRRDGTTGS
jgi:hypothetical protein